MRQRRSDTIAAAMCQDVVVHKPKVVRIPEGPYQTVVTSLQPSRRKIGSFWGSDDYLNNALSAASGEKIALNGPECNPNAELRPNTGNTFDIQARIKENYQFRYWTVQPGRRTNPKKSQYTGQIQSRRRRSGLSCNLESLAGRRNFINSDSLFARVVYDKHHITLEVQGFLKFSFKENPTSIAFESLEDLSEVLMRASQLLGETTESWLFEIAKSAGTVEKSSSHWLPERSSLFGRGDAQGTILEYGLLDEDEIRVYKKIPRPLKRRRLGGGAHCPRED
ncbi:hypothetical protein LTS15_003046 [Exophiala xenobiotica]|nr:hypothetical protein LTS15_003046 [Exophiala xenobiotica]